MVGLELSLSLQLAPFEANLPQGKLRIVRRHVQPSQQPHWTKCLQALYSHGAAHPQPEWLDITAAAGRFACYDVPLRGRTGGALPAIDPPVISKMAKTHAYCVQPLMRCNRFASQSPASGNTCAVLALPPLYAGLSEQKKRLDRLELPLPPIKDMDSGGEGVVQERVLVVPLRWPKRCLKD